MAPSPEEPQNEAQSHELIDVNVNMNTVGARESFMAIAALALGVLAIMPVNALLRSEETFQSIGLCLLIPCCATAAVALPLIVLRYARLATERRVRTIVSEGRGDPIQAVVERAFAVGTGFSGHFAHVMRALVAHGYLGTTIRWCASKEAVPIEPIRVDFEPRPLDQSDPSFVALESAASTGCADASPGSPSHTPGTTDDALALRIERATTVGGGKLITGFMLVFMLGLALTDWLASGRVVLPLLLDITTGVLISCLPAPGGGREQWLIVPGAVVLRKTRWLKKAWELHVFVRETSVLLVRIVGRGQAGIVVADAKGDYRARATARECNFLLRAWLSPLPPPSVDRLSDLA